MNFVDTAAKPPRPGAQDPGPGLGQARPFGIEIQHLLAFLAVYDERNVTLAARRLHRGQSAISHSLSRLRVLLGDELFVLRGGQMCATPAADELYPTIRQAAALIDSLRSERRVFNPRHDAVDFRIGMTDHEELVFSPRLWMEIAQRAPGVRLIVRSINRYAAEPMVLSGALDAAIVGNPVCRDPAIECRMLISDSYVVACSSRVPLRELTLDAYLAAQHLSVEVGGEKYGTVDNALQALGHARDVRCILPTYSRVPDMLRHSTLFATLAGGVFSRAAQDGVALQLHTPPFELPPVHMGMVSLQAARASSATGWICNLVETLSRQLQPAPLQLRSAA